MSSTAIEAILLGAALVFAAAVAQIYVVAYTATEMDLTAGTKVAVWATSLLVVAPLAVYTRRSLRDLLEDGVESTPGDRGGDSGR